MFYIFGYGSLINPASISKTLGRKIQKEELIIGTLPNYRRTWTVPVKVKIPSYPNQEFYEALFLDLTEMKGNSCNGVLIPIIESTLPDFDEREKQYERKKVTVQTEQGSIDSFAYIAPSHKKTQKGIILQKYLDLVKNAVFQYSLEFQKEYWKSTDQYPPTVIEGDYQFYDPDQNKAAGL